jgi:hypothetical protein
VSKFKVVPIEEMPAGGFGCHRLKYAAEYEQADALLPGEAFQALDGSSEEEAQRLNVAAREYASRKGKPWRVMRRGNSVWIARPK